MANVVHNTLTDADLHASERQYAGNPNGALTGVQGQYCEDTNTGNVYRCNGGTSWEKILDFSLAGLGATARTSLGLGSGDTPSFLSANFGVGTSGSKSSQIALKTYDNVDTITVDFILRSPSTANTVGSNRTVTLPDADGILAYWASGNTNNYLLTSNGSSGLVGESNLTYDGTDFVIQANVGIGTTSPSSKLNVVGSLIQHPSGAGNISYYGSDFSSILSSDSTSGFGTLYGIQNISDVYGLSSSARLGSYGIYNLVRRNTSGDVSSYSANFLYGILNTIQHLTDIDSSVVTGNAITMFNNNAIRKGTVNALQMTRNSLLLAGQANDSASITTAYGVLNVATIGATSGSGAGTLTNYYGFYDAPNVRLTGTITNYYGLYLGTPTVTGTLTNRWAIYSADSSAKTFIAGDVGIGTSSPTEELEVSGTIKCTDLTITGTANAQGELQENGINVARYRGNFSSAPTTDVQDGDIYADTNFNPVRVYIRAATEWLRIA